MIKEQLSKESKQESESLQQASAEGRFLELIQDLEMKFDKNSPGWTRFDKNSEWYGFYESKHKNLCCRNDKVWNVFETEFGWDSDKIRSFIKEQVYKHFKLDGIELYCVYDTDTVYKQFGWALNLDKIKNKL